MQIHFFNLTNTIASEQLYGRELQQALESQGINFVEDWGEADIVHLFEVNFFTRDAITAFKIPKLINILRSNTPVVVSTDDLYFIGEPSLTARPRLYPLNHRTQRLLFRYCDAVIAISESVRTALQPALDDTPISVVHHGVDDRYFADFNEADDPFVLHVSLASKRKNPAAIASIADRMDARFVVAGGGWDEYLPPSDRPSNLEVTGYLPEDDLVELYDQASVFYFPTYHEGFGLPLLEAMAASDAVVTSDVYSVPEVVGDAAIQFDPDAIEEHLSAIRRLFADADYRRHLSEAAHERAHSFSWEATAERTQEVYRMVVDQL